MMRPLYALIGLSVLVAACGREEGDTAGAERDPAPAASSPRWILTDQAPGATLRLEDRGETVAALSCRGGEMQAQSDRFQPVSSEERFSVGMGDDSFILVADLDARRDQGVEARGDISGVLLERMEAGQPLAFNYGAQNLGPFPPVPEADARAFAQACREMSG